MKKLCVYILIICLALTMVPLPAFADDSATASAEPAVSAGPVSEPAAKAVDMASPAADAEEPAIPMNDTAVQDDETVLNDPAVPVGSGEKAAVPSSPEEVFEEEIPLESAEADGWVTDAEGHRYYYVDGVPVTGIYDIDGARYCFDETGIMQTGWMIDESGNRFWFGEDGIMAIGFREIAGKTYYFSAEGIMQTGLKKIDGVRYYFKAKGPMKTGVVKLNGKMFYFMEDGRGVMRKGWFKGIDKKKRYCYGNARIAFGTKKIKKIWYEFSKKNGRLVRRIGDDIDKSIQSKTSSTSWLIILKISEHKVRIYKGKQNKWTRAHTFRCTTGASSTPTPRGTYTIKSRGLFFDTGSSMRCWYYTQFYGNYLFHSVLYDRSPTPRHIVDGRLGINASHGCVRLALGNAKWIYQNIPSGTKVVIF